MKKYPESIIEATDSNRCFLCHRTGSLQVHHVMNSWARKKSTKYGLTVHLCPTCHYEVHNGDGRKMLLLKQVAQKKFESKYSHELWIKEFKRNYL